MLSLARRLAQEVRHNPALGFLNPMWTMLRRPYLKFMTVAGQRRGIAVAIAGVTMRLHPEFCTQNWESIEVESYAAFSNAVSPGNVVFDVGAHIGTYTIIAAKGVGPGGRVIAYEPHDYTRMHLERHLHWNNVKSQTVVCDVCCGAEDGCAELYFLSGRAEGCTGVVPIEGFQKRAVRVVKLDSEVVRLGVAPDILKIDVEGAELDVLRGAEETLRRARPVIVLSMHPRALMSRSESSDQILDWLRQHGYAPEVIATDYEIHAVALPVHRQCK